jgi:hypothetical protein
MNRGNFKGDLGPITNRNPKYAKCDEVKYYEMDKKKLHDISTTNVAVDSWYSGIKEYDFTAG